MHDLVDLGILLARSEQINFLKILLPKHYLNYSSNLNFFHLIVFSEGLKSTFFIVQS
jgi:hypothetical protein